MMKSLLAALLLLTASSALAAGYAGADVGYLTDSRVAFYAAHVGFDVAKSSQLVQSAEVEVGYTTDRESNIKADILPVMANYRLTFGEPGSKLGYYAAGGIGASNVKLSGFYYLHDSSWAFTLQALAGVEFKVAPNTAVKLGLRYIWIDEVKLFGYKAAVGDDLAVETGVSFHF
jgi:opacity protein-like surface antigen